MQKHKAGSKECARKLGSGEGQEVGEGDLWWSKEGRRERRIAMESVGSCSSEGTYVWAGQPWLEREQHSVRKWRLCFPPASPCRSPTAPGRWQG